MKNYLMISALFVGLFALGCLAAAGNLDAATPAPSAPTLDEVVVTVNGVDITEGQIAAEIKPQLEKLTAQSQQLPPSVVDQYKVRLRQQATEALITMRLLDEKVKEAKIVVTDEEELDQIKQIATRQGLSLDDFKMLIEAYGQTFDQWKQQMRFRQGLAYQKLMDAEFAGRVNVTDDDAKKFYDENQQRFEIPEQVRASHILVKPDTTDPAADPNQTKAKAKEKAQELLKLIREGVDFAELAKTNSGDPGSAERGGDLGLFGRGQMVPPFENAAFALKVGQVSDIVESQFGYHIIKVTDHKDPNLITFDKAKEDIVRMLTQQKQGELALQYVESLKANAKIVYTPGKEPAPQDITP
jgi:peptidyl-prolyl cis-trans isomerase C